MGVLDELLAGLDNARRVGGRNIQDLYNDPAAYAEKIVGHLRNANAGVAPVVAGGELTNRPLTERERAEQAFGAMDFGGGLGVVKLKGGNWATDPHQSPSNIKRIIGQGDNNYVGRENYSGSPSETMANWRDSAVVNYLKNQMGTPEDPLRRLAEEGITHFPSTTKPNRGAGKEAKELRESMGFPAKGMAKSPEAKRWETISDSNVLGIKNADLTRGVETAKRLAADESAAFGPPGPRTFEDMLNIVPLTPQHQKDLEALHPIPGGVLNGLRSERYDKAHPEFGAVRKTSVPDYSWASKDPEGATYGLKPFADFGLGAVHNFVKGRLIKGEITADQLRSGRYGVEAAVRDYSDVLRKGEAEAKNPTSVFKMPDEGLEAVRLDRPGQFAAESDSMGHSVRGYEPHGISGGDDMYGHGGHGAIKSGKAEVYSIRDEKGKPGATIEVFKDPKHGDRMVTQIKGKFNRAVDPKFVPAIKKFLREGDLNVNMSDMDKSGLLKMEMDDGSTEFMTAAEREAYLKSIQGR